MTRNQRTNQKSYNSSAHRQADRLEEVGLATMTVLLRVLAQYGGWRLAGGDGSHKLLLFIILVVRQVLQIYVTKITRKHETEKNAGRKPCGISGGAYRLICRAPTEVYRRVFGYVYPTYRYRTAFQGICVPSGNADASVVRNKFAPDGRRSCYCSNGCLFEWGISWVAK